MKSNSTFRYWPHGKPIPPGWRATPGIRPVAHHDAHSVIISRNGPPMLLGLCGPEGAGKSTVARLLQDRFAFSVHPFAAPLKKMIEALGVPRGHLYGTPEEKEAPLDLFCGRSARHAMQTLGTEWGRQCIGADFWLSAWSATLPADAGGIVADDVRFPNEAALIQSKGGAVLCVTRREAEREVKHASENWRAIPSDFEIANDGSLDDLSTRVETLVRQIAGGERV